jgi:hypothetical protein
LLDFHENWQEGDDIQEDLDAITFNPLVSTILKWLTINFKSSALLSNGSGLKLRHVFYKGQ